MDVRPLRQPLLPPHKLLHYITFRRFEQPISRPAAPRRAFLTFPPPAFCIFHQKPPRSAHNPAFWQLLTRFLHFGPEFFCKDSRSFPPFPAGTAGKPILGQINSHELTDILIVVVRYFGGIKLGTSGLIQAYKAAAIEALDKAHVVERTVDEDVSFWIEYPFMNAVMRVVKEEGPAIVSQGYEQDCSMTLRIRKGSMPRLKARLEKVETLRFAEE